MKVHCCPTCPRLFYIISFTAALSPLPLQGAAESSVSGTSLFELVAQGGWAMYPLGLLMLGTFYLTFHCFSQTLSRRFFSTEQEQVLQLLQRGELSSAEARFNQQSTVVGRLMLISLKKARLDRPDANREAMEAAFVEAAEAEENAVGQWINYLNVIATVAPMVGLLGTVSGMIGAFQKIGQGGMGKPDELAGNIGEALITTATGLVIGIPAMIAYFYFKNRLSTRMLTVGRVGGDMLDQLEDASGESRHGRSNSGQAPADYEPVAG